ncbi:MAG: hypothetical protein HYV09_06775 [Deltaproteobacteria bacterium]|nr:hypothetical protein [Deltaproteobacteria bacterium]
MRTRTVLTLLAGSVTVHLAISCANVADHGGSGSLADAIADVVRDALGGETPKADAAPPAGWTSDEVPCDKSFVSSGLTLYYAEKAYPGRTKEDLAHAIVLDCATEMMGFPVPPTTECGVRPPLLKDGALIAQCGRGSAGRVRFLVPPP